MIPLAIPRDGEVVNLSQIVRVEIHPVGRCHECERHQTFDEILSPENPQPEKKVVHAVGQQPACTVYFVDGIREIYDGEASRIINTEIHFLLNSYRELQIAATSQIVTPDGNQGIIM